MFPTGSPNTLNEVPTSTSPPHIPFKFSIFLPELFIFPMQKSTFLLKSPHIIKSGEIVDMGRMLMWRIWPQTLDWHPSRVGNMWGICWYGQNVERMLMWRIWPQAPIEGGEYVGNMLIWTESWENVDVKNLASDLRLAHIKGGEYVDMGRMLRVCWCWDLNNSYIGAFWNAQFECWLVQRPGNVPLASTPFNRCHSLISHWKGGAVMTSLMIS